MSRFSFSMCLIISMGFCAGAVGQVQSVEVTGRVLLPGGVPVQCKVRAKPRDGTGTFGPTSGKKFFDTTDGSGKYELGIDTDEPITLIVDDGGSEIEYTSLGYWDKNLKIDCELDPSIVQKKLGLLQVIGSAVRQFRNWNRWIPEGQAERVISIREVEGRTITVHVPADKAKLLAIDFAMNIEQRGPFTWIQDKSGMNLKLPNEEAEDADLMYPSVALFPRQWLRANPQWTKLEGPDWSRAATIPVLRVNQTRVPK